LGRKKEKKNIFWCARRIAPKTCKRKKEINSKFFFFRIFKCFEWNDVRQKQIDFRLKSKHQKRLKTKDPRR
jgi:hypothetical protein